MYKLKRGVEAFDMVDGPLAGKKYRHGETYPEKDIPPAYKDKFEKVKVQAEAKRTAATVPKTSPPEERRTSPPVKPAAKPADKEEKKDASDTDAKAVSKTADRSGGPDKTGRSKS